MEGLQRIRDLGPEALEAVLPALEGALRRNHDVGAVARIIGSLGRRGASLAPALVAAYPKCSDNEKSMILTALVAIAPADDLVAQLCRGALSDPNPLTGLRAAGYLLRYGYDVPAAMQRLLQALRDPSSPIGFLAAQLLGEAGTNALAAVPELERVTQSGTIEMRWSATNALLRIRAAAEP
jgi:HEAT repeat protein